MQRGTARKELIGTGMKIIVVVNEGGGTAQDTGESLAAAFDKAGLDVEIVVSDSDRLKDAIEAAVQQRPDVLVAGGGDGTISLAAELAVAHDLVLGVLPLGTLNHLARDAGIPAALEEAVAVIAAGNVRRIDVGEVNGHLFVNNSAVGLYPHMVRDREAQQRRLGRSKRVAMMIASIRALRHFGRKRLTIVAQGDRQPIETPLLFVGNNDYDISLFSLGRRAALDRGELCVYALLARSRRELIGMALRGLIGLLQQKDFIRLTGVREAEIRSRRPSLSVSMDGETVLLETPLCYRIRPGALQLLAPPNVEAAEP
jgi:diacylglycerol kinase family enzyme